MIVLHNELFKIKKVKNISFNPKLCFQANTCVDYMYITNNKLFFLILILFRFTKFTPMSGLLIFYQK
jgi:hypothetical protein